MKHAFALTAALILTSTHLSYASPFTNGSFEGTGFIDTETGRPGYMNLTAGSTLIPGWTIVTDIDWQTTWIAPADGLKSIDLNGFSPGAIEQTFDTIAGQEYLVTFSLAGNVNDSPALKTGRISAAGQSETFQFDVTGHSISSPGYVDTTFNFTANSSSTTLLFESLTPNSAGGAIIDNVRVVATPEPATLSVMGIAAAAVLRRANRSR